MISKTLQVKHTRQMKLEILEKDKIYHISIEEIMEKEFLLLMKIKNIF